MPVLEVLAFFPLTPRTSNAWRAATNRHVKEAVADFLFLEYQREARTRTPEIESSAAALRPGTPVFATTLLVFFLAIGMNSSWAVSSDMGLLALIPPGSEVVAEIRATSINRQTSNYSFITSYNRIDLSDFVAIIGSDQSRLLDYVIFTASSGHNGAPIEHSILVSGHFNHDRIFRASSANETIIRYGGMAVLDVSPFERERNSFRHRRWLVLIGSSTAIFGTVASVEEEIARSLAGLPPDAAILQRLACLQRDDEEWSLLPVVGHGTAVSYQLRLLDPRLAELAENGDSLAFGIRHGRRVELEFVVNFNSNFDAMPLSDSVPAPSADLRNHESLLSSRSDPSRVGDRVEHRVLKLSKSQFQKWVAQASITPHEVLPSVPKRATPK